MSQSKKKEADNRSVEKAPGSKIIDRAPKWSRPGLIIAAVVIAIILITLGSLVGGLIGWIIGGAGIAVMLIVLGWKVSPIASVVIAVILIIVGVFYYQERVAPFQRTIITVDDITINMDYFLKRTRLAGVDPMRMLDMLSREQVIILAAPQFGIEISPEDIDQVLREIARGESETISESEFKAWYRQTLNENGLSDSEYREIMVSALLNARLHEYLAERMPTVAEQIHLHTILAESYEDAQTIRARLEAGEDFADLARETSLDEESGGKGGDLGWLPRGVLDPQIEYVAFSLSTGNVSEPVPYYIGDPMSDPNATLIYYLLKVSEKAAAREVSEEHLPILKARVLDDWLSAEKGFHEIKYNFNSEIYAWISWQLAKQ